jgi:hypothetical protein
MLRRILVLLAAALVTGAAAPAVHAATDEERAAARSAAGQGVDAFEAQRYEEAVELLQRAEALVHSPVHLLYIARAQLKLGRWVKAYEALMRINREQVSDTAPDAVKRALEEGRRELAQLQPQLPYVTVTVKNAAGGAVEVTMDGAPVPPAMVGLSRPVDPGVHEFRASGDGRQSEVVRVEVQPAAKLEVELELKGTRARSGSASPRNPSPLTAPPATSRNEDTASGSGLKIAGYTALGVGIAGGALGAVFLSQSAGKTSDADELCGSEPAGCDPANRSQIEALDKDAASAQTLAVIGFGVGAAGIGTGIILLLLPSGNQARAQPRPSLLPYLTSSGAGVSGSF